MEEEKLSIVVFPTMRQAVYEWRRLKNTYSDAWIECRQYPMSLTSVTGMKYMFYSETETDKLRGLRGDFITIDDIENLM